MAQGRKTSHSHVSLDRRETGKFAQFRIPFLGQIFVFLAQFFLCSWPKIFLCSWPVFLACVCRISALSGSVELCSRHRRPIRPQCNSHSFDEEFFEEVSQRFRDINSHQVVPGLFDAPFSPSELRRALNLCFDSAVGADGLPYSVFKTNYPWWQSAVLPSSSLGVWFPHRGSAALWFQSLKVGTRLWPPIFAPFLWPVAVSKSLSTCFTRELGYIFALSWMNVKVVFAGVRTLWLGLLSIFSLHVRPCILTCPSSTPTKLSIPLGSKVLFDAGVSGQMWKLMSHFLHGTITGSGWLFPL